MSDPQTPVVEIPSPAVLDLEALAVPEAIARRRATRKFDPDRPVAEATLKAILHLATLAPSGYNLQPWRFVVVRSARNRERLKACAYGQSKIGEAPVVVIVLAALHPQRSDLEPILESQKRLGAISDEAAHQMRVNATRARENDPHPEVWATRSTMLAAATLMIAAESLGVASAPMEGFEAEKVREAFGVPDDHIVCCLIALGHAAEQKPFPGRLGLGRVCFEEHFGQPWTLGEVEDH